MAGDPPVIVMIDPEGQPGSDPASHALVSKGRLADVWPIPVEMIIDITS